MMQKYELVLMLKSQIQESERNELLSKIEKDFKDNILLKDEMGIHETSYDIK
jgi:ribosomal protein S6